MSAASIATNTMLGVNILRAIPKIGSSFGSFLERGESLYKDAFEAGAEFYNQVVEQITGFGDGQILSYFIGNFIDPRHLADIGASNCPAVTCPTFKCPKIECPEISKKVAEELLAKELEKEKGLLSLLFLLPVPIFIFTTASIIISLLLLYIFSSSLSKRFKFMLPLTRFICGIFTTVLAFDSISFIFKNILMIISLSIGKIDEIKNPAAFFVCFSISLAALVYVLYKRLSYKNGIRRGLGSLPIFVGIALFYAKHAKYSEDSLLAKIVSIVFGGESKALQRVLFGLYFFYLFGLYFIISKSNRSYETHDKLREKKEIYIYGKKSKKSFWKWLWGSTTASTA